MEGGEHSSRELTVSVKVPFQEFGGRGYLETVEAGHVVGHPSESFVNCGGSGLVPDDVPLSQFRDMLR